MSIWDDVSNKGKGGFSPLEKWGDAYKMNGALLWFLFMVRIETGWPIIIHEGYATTGHTENSQHYKANAVDWHFDCDVDYKYQVDRLLQIAEEKQVSNFMGIGIYPTWHNPGFHTDNRGEEARWGFIGNTYVSFLDAYKSI